MKSAARWILFLAYVAWVVTLTLRHEIWRDEADVWVAARDQTLWHLLKSLGYAGTPGLWYLLVMPLAKAGLPVISMQILHALLAIAAVGLLIFFSPFPFWFTALLSFSYLMAFEYSIVARPYVLIVLLLFLTAICITAKKPRWIWAGVAVMLLANTTVHGLFIAAIIGLVLLVRQVAQRKIPREVLIGGSIALIGGMASVAQLLPSSKTVPPSNVRRWPVTQYMLAESTLPQIPHARGSAIYYTHNHSWATMWSDGVRGTGSAALLYICFLLRKHRDALSIVLGCWMALTYIFVFKWYQGERHAGLLLIVGVFGLWLANWKDIDALHFNRPLIARLTSTLGRSALIVSLLVSCGVAMRWGYRQWRFEYSGSRQAAAFIREHCLDCFPIATGPDSRAEALLPYLPTTQLWYSGRREFGTFVRWDRDWHRDNRLSDEEIVFRARSKFQSSPHLLLIAGNPIRDGLHSEYRMLFQSSDQVFGRREERYFLYAWNGVHR